MVKVNKYERFKNVPHFDLIIKNGEIKIPSIFMFDNCEDLYSFLYACRKYNCIVCFENEDIKVEPDQDISNDIRVFAYTTVMSCREIGDAYIRYLGNIAKMKWELAEQHGIIS